jgi:transporter family-2 protein
MPNNWFFLLLALLAGAILPAQAAMNNKLAAYAQNPVLAAFISFVVGLLALMVYMLATGVSLGNLAAIKGAPFMAWMGGLCGAFFVTAVIVVVPRLGVALTFSIIVAGQMLATLPIDHYGFLGTAVKEINLPRLLGVVFVIAGVILIRRF